MKSNINVTCLVKLSADDVSCFPCKEYIYYGLHPQNTYLQSLCLVKSIVIVAVVYGYDAYDQ